MLLYNNRMHCKTFKYGAAFAGLLLMTGCFNHWSEEERHEFEATCAQTKTFNNEVFLFRGFKNSELDSVQVKEYDGEKILDSFKFYVWPARDENETRSGHIERPMNINYNYHFIIPSQKPYILSDMKI